MQTANIKQYLANLGYGVSCIDVCTLLILYRIVLIRTIKKCFTSKHVSRIMYKFANEELDCLNKTGDKKYKPWDVCNLRELLYKHM